MMYPGDLQKENKSSLKGTNSTKSSKNPQRKRFKDNEQVIGNKHENHRETSTMNESWWIFGKLNKSSKTWKAGLLDTGCVIIAYV